MTLSLWFGSVFFALQQSTLQFVHFINDELIGTALPPISSILDTGICLSASGDFVKLTDAICSAAIPANFASSKRLFVVHKMD